MFLRDRDRAPANSGLSLLTASAKAQGQGAPEVGNCKSGALLQEVLLMILWGKAHAGLRGRGGGTWKDNLWFVGEKTLRR